MAYSPPGTKRKADCSRQQLLDLLIAQKGRRASTQVKLGQALARAQHRHVQVDLFVDSFEVGNGTVVPPGHHLVAGTVVTDRLAKRDVNVNRQRRRSAAHRTRATGPLRQRLKVLLGAKGLDKSICGGIGGVAGARHVQTRQRLLGDRWWLDHFGLSKRLCIHGRGLCQTSRPVG